MQNSFNHTHTIKLYHSQQGEHHVILMSLTEKPIEKNIKITALSGAVFLLRLFQNQFPFVASVLPENTPPVTEIDKRIVKLYENIYLLPLKKSQPLEKLAQTDLFVYNSLTWDIIKEGQLSFESDEHHTKFNVYRFLITP